MRLSSRRGYGTTSFGLMLRGVFISVAGFAASHLWLTQYPKNVWSACSSTFHVTNPIFRVWRKSSRTSRFTSTSSEIPLDRRSPGTIATSSGTSAKLRIPRHHEIGDSHPARRGFEENGGWPPKWSAVGVHSTKSDCRLHNSGMAPPKIRYSNLFSQEFLMFMVTRSLWVPQHGFELTDHEMHFCDRYSFITNWETTRAPVQISTDPLTDWHEY